MITAVHEHAVVSPEARIAPNAVIGPYSVIGPGVSIGEGTSVGAHVVIEGDTVIGRRNRIYPGCVIGSDPQDKGCDCPSSAIRIGDDNVIREYVTVHRSSRRDGMTSIGSGTMITMSDIAEKAGVSRATVSFVLNGRRTGVSISEPTSTSLVRLMMLCPQVITTFSRSLPQITCIDMFCSGYRQ